MQLDFESPFSEDEKPQVQDPVEQVLGANLKMFLEQMMPQYQNKDMHHSSDFVFVHADEFAAGMDREAQMDVNMSLASFEDHNWVIRLGESASSVNVHVHAHENALDQILAQAPIDVEQYNVLDLLISKQVQLQIGFQHHSGDPVELDILECHFGVDDPDIGVSYHWLVHPYEEVLHLVQDQKVCDQLWDWYLKDQFDPYYLLFGNDAPHMSWMKHYGGDKKDLL